MAPTARVRAFSAINALEKKIIQTFTCDVAVTPKCYQIDEGQDELKKVENNKLFLR